MTKYSLAELLTGADAMKQLLVEVDAGLDLTPVGREYGSDGLTAAEASALLDRLAVDPTVRGMAEFRAAFAHQDPRIMLEILLTPDTTLGGQTPLQVLLSEGWTGALERIARIDRRGDGFG